MSSQVSFIVVDPRDNVGTTVVAAVAGDILAEPGTKGPEGHRPRLVAFNAIPAGHKVALRDIPEGGTVFKYGAVIGVATSAIRAGELVHIHNMKSARGKGFAGGEERP